MPQPPLTPNEDLRFRLSLIRLLTEPHAIASQLALRAESSQIEELATQLPPQRRTAGRVH